MAEHLKDEIRRRAPARRSGDRPRRLPPAARPASSEARAGARRHRHPPGSRGDLRRDSIAIAADGVIGHVTIQRGCDKFCTFCVVPYTRGRERGAAPREILRQVRALVEAGVKEVQLLGQTVNSYRYEDVGFAALLRAVAAVDGVERVRFTSPYPLDFADDVVAAIAETSKICKHVHLPLQSASDAVLARMRRGYDFATFRALYDKLRGGAGHRDHDRPAHWLLRRDRGRVPRDAARAGGAALRRRVHVRVLRTRGDLRRAQDARHRARRRQAAPARGGDRAAAADHAARSWRRRSASASACSSSSASKRSTDELIGADRRVPPGDRPGGAGARARRAGRRDDRARDARRPCSARPARSRRRRERAGPWPICPTTRSRCCR